MVTRALGLCLNLVYAGLIVWVYAMQPASFDEATGGLTSAVGAYRVDPVSFEEGLRFFRHDQFVEARSALARADPARRDSTTQFYVAYSYYRQGWGRLYSDDELFRKGIEALDRAVAVAPEQRIAVPDPDLRMATADELRAELVRGLTREASDLNPLGIFRERK
jgi:hypothetical protein